MTQTFIFLKDGELKIYNSRKWKIRISVCVATAQPKSKESHCFFINYLAQDLPICG